MGKSLRDALLSAGVRSSKVANERPKIQEKEKTKTMKHQEERNMCEACDKMMPDVEFYAHKNPLLDAKWLCVSCADQNMIHDKFRTSAQSEYSRKGVFRREYGETIKNVGDKPKFENSRRY